MKHVGSILLAACFGALTASAQYKSINPQVSKIVSEVSEERITAALKKLQGFGTRNLRSSQDDPNRGIGAAGKWIYEQFHSYSPRLEVSYDHDRVKKDPSRGSRIPQDVDVYNVLAVLPGTIDREQRIVIGAHYDSVNRTGTPRGQPGDPPPPVCDPNINAPGVTDDGSGVACVMDLARVMSQYQFEKRSCLSSLRARKTGRSEALCTQRRRNRWIRKLKRCSTTTSSAAMWAAMGARRIGR
jgi:hypothetical protein